MCPRLISTFRATSINSSSVRKNNRCALGDQVIFSKNNDVLSQTNAPIPVCTKASETLNSMLSPKLDSGSSLSHLFRVPLTRSKRLGKILSKAVYTVKILDKGRVQRFLKNSMLLQKSQLCSLYYSGQIWMVPIESSTFDVSLSEQDLNRAKPGSYPGSAEKAVDCENGSSAPRFSTGLQDVEAESGQHVELTCCVTGSPAPSVKWFMGKSEVGTSVNLSVLTRSCAPEALQIEHTSSGCTF